MFETLKKAFKVKEIRVKIWWTLLFLLIYRIGCYIPVPGVGTALLSETDLTQTSYLQIMSMMTGGSLAQGTLFAMGIGPYINSSIIIQLLAVAIPPLERLSKQGEEGRKKIANYTRYLTLLLAVIQSVGILVSYGSVTGSDSQLVRLLAGGADNVTGFTKFLTYVIMILFYTAGTCITMWIGERITDHGVSNGISLLIFAGIIASAGQFFVQECTTVFGGSFDSTARIELLRFVGYLLIIIVVFGAIVWVELALVGWTKGSSWWSTWLGANSRYPFYAIALCLFIVFFAFFYSQIQFNPEDISKTIQQNGGFIPGIRPGKPTADYLKKINDRLTLFGAIFLAILALIPTVVLNLILPSNASSGAFSATGMLICVSVAIEFNTALESQIMMKAHKGFLK